MTKKKKPMKFEVRVVYGFQEKLTIVLLGELKSGTVADGMQIEIAMASGTVVGTWEINKVLRTDFINKIENPNFMGLRIECKNLANFNLLKSLRIYDEVINIIE